MPLTWQLCLPESWVKEPERCMEVGIPTETPFQPTWEIGLALVDRARSWGLADQVLGTDAGYGHSHKFRDGLDERRLKYVVGVTEEMAVWVGNVPAVPPPPKGPTGRPPCRWDYTEHKPQSLLEVAQTLPESAWQEVTWTKGSKGPLRPRIVALRGHVAHGWVHSKAPRPECWLLIEWPAGEQKPDLPAVRREIGA